MESSIVGCEITGSIVVWRPSLSINERSILVSVVPVVVANSAKHHAHDIVFLTKESMWVALLSMAMRAIPSHSAVVPGLCTRQAALLQAKVAMLEAQIRDLHASQGIIKIHNLVEKVMVQEVQLNAVIEACDGLEREIETLVE